eukprot:7466303-Lingulodinium_polyedra.AAC.1
MLAPPLNTFKGRLGRRAIKHLDAWGLSWFVREEPAGESKQGFGVSSIIGLLSKGSQGSNKSHFVSSCRPMNGLRKQANGLPEQGNQALQDIKGSCEQ